MRKNSVCAPRYKHAVIELKWACVLYVHFVCVHMYVCICRELCIYVTVCVSLVWTVLLSTQRHNKIDWCRQSVGSVPSNISMSVFSMIALFKQGASLGWDWMVWCLSGWSRRTKCFSISALQSKVLKHSRSWRKPELVKMCTCCCALSKWMGGLHFYFAATWSYQVC